LAEQLELAIFVEEGADKSTIGINTDLEGSSPWPSDETGQGVISAIEVAEVGNRQR